MTESAYARRGLDLGTKTSGGTGALRFGLASCLRTGRSALRGPATQYPTSRSPHAARAGDKLRSLRLRAFIF